MKTLTFSSQHGFPSYLLFSNPSYYFKHQHSSSNNPYFTPYCSRDRQFLQRLTPEKDHNHLCSSYGRRTTILISTLPFLFIQAYDAEAVESEAKESMVIKEEIRKVLSKGKAAGVLRLVFHDAGTFEMDDQSGGMNGSIVYELDRTENAGLKKSLKIIQKAKSEVDAIQPVSWADMIAVAGAEAVSLCGGPTIPIRIGRLDSMKPDPEDRLPLESLDAFGLKQCFQRKGLSTQELVALSGAHTLGSKGFGNPVVFDNSYYKILLDKPWTSSDGMSKMVGLPSDRALVEDDECLRWIKKYAESQDIFFQDFKNAYIKLVNSGASQVVVAAKGLAEFSSKSPPRAVKELARRIGVVSSEAYICSDERIVKVQNLRIKL